MNNLKIKIKDGEYWWGGLVDDAYRMPLGIGSDYTADLTHNMSYNQCSPLFLSSKGRFIWNEKGYKISFSDGEISVEGEDIVFDESGKTLKDAYHKAQINFFPPDGSFPNELMFKVPQYCTWIELLSEQTENGILGYAKSIIEAGMPAGEIIIDNGWQRDYGDWEFDAAKFSDPRSMVKKLHDMGFKVILWIVPYLSPDGKEFLQLNERGALIKKTDGSPLITEWWEGYSAVLDFSNPIAVKWFRSRTKHLMDEYGVDGFKLDGGDARFINEPIECFEPDCDANRQSELYVLEGLQYGFNELRAAFKCGGRGVAQRIADRHHTWDIVLGVGSLIPNASLQGLLGYSYTCPDMVGGGLSGDFTGEARKHLDEELFIRSCQCSSLMPMMQLSFAFWRVFTEKTIEICIKYTSLHAEMHDYIMKYVENSALNGEPVIRNIAYQFNEGEEIKDQFMLGDEYLVAPVINKGQTKRTVKLFDGKWVYVPTGEVFEKGEAVIDAPIDVLPYFKRVG